MTRINSAIKVVNLTDEHLLAEHREIKRICNRFEMRLQKNKFDDIPTEFCLGSGHELFFVDKPIFTLNRYKQIYNECIKRGFKVEDYSTNWKIYSNSEFSKNDYVPSKKDSELLIERITQRLSQTTKNNWHYYSESITKEDAINLLTS